MVVVAASPPYIQGVNFVDLDPLIEFEKDRITLTKGLVEFQIEP